MSLTAGLLGLAVLLLGGVWALSNTEGGQDWLAAQVESLASTPGERRVEIEGLRGRLPQSLRLETVRLYDAEGLWLEVEEARLDWLPLALFSRNLHLRELSADRVALHRTPLPGAQPEEPPTREPSVERFRIPELPVTLRLDRLSVASFELGSDLAGEPARLALEGHAAAPEGGALETELSVERLDSAGGFLALDATLLPATRELDLDLRVEDPPGGLLADLADLPGEPGLDLRLNGSGPLEDWRGALSSRLGDLATIDAEIALSLPSDRREPIAAEVTGRATAPGFLDERTRPLAGEGFDFNLAARQLENEVTIERIALATTALRLSGNAILDTGANTVEGELAAESLDDAALARLTGPVALAGLEINLTAAGALPLPQLAAEIRVDQIDAPDSRLSQVRLDAEVTPDSPHAREGMVSARLRAGTLDLAPPQAAGISGAPLALNLDGRLDLEDQRLNDLRLALDYAVLALSAEGGIGWQPLDLDGNIKLAVSDLVAFNAAAQGLNADFDLAGRLDLGAEVALRREEDGLALAATADLAGETIALGQPLGEVLIGPKPRLTARVAMDPDGTLRLSEAKLDGQALSAEADFDLLPEEESVDGRLLVTLDDLERFSNQAGRPLSGQGRLDAQIAGSLDATRIRADLDVTALQVDGFDLGSLRARLRAEGPLEEPQGHFALSGESSYGELAAETTFAVSPQTARVENFSITLPGVSLTAPAFAVALGNGGPLAEGDLRLSAPDLSQVESLAALGELQARGALDATLRLDSEAGRQNATLAADLDDLTLQTNPQAEPITLRSATLRGEGSDVIAAANLEAELVAQGLALGTAEARSVTLTAAGTAEAVDLDLAAEAGLQDVEIALTSAAQLRPQPGGLVATLQSFDAQVNERSFRLLQPAELARQDGAVLVQDFLLAAEDGEIALDLALDQEEVDGALSVNALPLSLTEAFMPEQSLAGRLDLDITLEGPADAPSGALRLALDGVASDAAAELPPLSGLVEGQLGAGRLRLDGRVEGLTQEGFAIATDLPLRLSFSPFAYSIEEQEAFTAALNWQGELAPLMGFAPATGHDLQGQGQIDLHAEGTLAHPTITGALAIQEGSYENYDTGTLLRGLELRLEGNEDRLTLVRLEATDGGRGEIAGSGDIIVDPQAGFPMDFHITADDAVLLRRDEVWARADADIEILGDLQNLTVSGRIVTDEVEARLPDELPPNVVDLGAVAAGSEEAAEAEDSAEAEEDQAPSVVHLDITVDLPNRIFARGAGLDSEWEGNLRITGTAAQPTITGEIREVRGQLSFLGRTFTFSNAVIRFDGGREIDPILDITADHSTRDVEVQVLVTGRASDPQIALTSTPELPQDEIVARVLFGRSAGQLGAMEAAQLALAVQQLRGGGPGLLDRLRDTLGVDVLRFSGGGGEEEEEGPSVTAGRYLTEGVFLGVEQGTARRSSAVTVEVELTDNIVLESDVGAGGESNVGIQFRWDY